MDNQALKLLKIDNKRRLEEMADRDDTFDSLTAENVLNSIIGFPKSIAYHQDRDCIVLLDDVYLDDNHKLLQGDFKDHYYTIITAFLNSTGFRKIPRQTLRDSVDAVAFAHEINTWDMIMDEVKSRGKYREGIYKEIMINWLRADDNEYSIFWLKSIMASIVRNQSYKGNIDTYDPVPQRYIMFGAQGIGKSQFLSKLSFGSQMDFNGKLDDKDTQSIMTSKIIINADDKANNKISVVDAIKSAITVPSFTYRPAYARNTITKLNRAVWVGSTNRLYVYTDTTGNRREMPIDLGVGLTATQCRKHGQEYFINTLQNDRLLFTDLWYTFLKDNEEEKINAVVKADSKIDEQRIKLVNDHQVQSDLDIALTEILATLVPSSFSNFKKDDQISFLIGENYKTGSKETIMASHDELVTISKLRELNASAINKAANIISNSHSKVSQIESNMFDLGYNSKRNASSRLYIKRG